MHDRTKSDEFHVEEYKALRSEIEQGVEELRKYRRNALIAVFAVYAWLATGGPLRHSDLLGESAHRIFEVAWWLPVLIPIIGFVEYLGIMMRNMHIGAYIRRIEAVYADDSLKGWEHVLEQLRSEKPFVARAQGFSGFILWPLLLAITIVVALLT